MEVVTPDVRLMGLWKDKMLLQTVSYLRKWRVHQVRSPHSSRRNRWLRNMVIGVVRRRRRRGGRVPPVDMAVASNGHPAYRGEFLICSFWSGICVLLMAN